MLNPKDIEAYFALGRVLDHQGDVEEAEDIYRQAIWLDGWELEFLGTLQLGNFFELHNRFEEAEQVYRELISRYPDSTDAYQLLGSFLERQERYEEAERVYRQQVDYFIQNSEHYAEVEDVLQTRSLVHYAYYILGSFFERSERYQEAEEAYRELAYHYPDDAGAYLLLGNVLELQGRNAEAQEAYRKAAEIDPSLLQP